MNRRFHYRADLGIEATCLQLDRNGTPAWGARARVVELSAGGARVIVEAPVEQGTRLVLRLELVDTIDLPAIATVVRIYGEGHDGRQERCVCGLRFEFLDQEQKALLARFVFQTAGGRARTDRAALEQDPAAEE